MKSVIIAVILLVSLLIFTTVYSIYLSDISKNINTELEKLKKILPEENINEIKHKISDIEKIWKEAYPMLLSYNDHNDVINTGSALASAILFAERENYDELDKSLSDFKIQFNALIDSNIPSITNLL